MENNKNAICLYEGCKVSEIQSSQYWSGENTISQNAPQLPTLLVRLLLDENLRENYLKGCWFNSAISKENTTSFPASRPFAEQLVLEVCSE